MLILYMARTGLRYASVSGYLNIIITLELINDITSSIHGAITKESYKRMVEAKVKIFYLLPFQWFLSGETSLDSAEGKKFNKRSNIRGWVLSIVISLILTGLMFWILQEILFPI